jgi:DNA-binding response OmpR family regulator
MARILLVDMNPATRDSLLPALRDEGYTVRIAYDGRQAMRAKQEFSPDLILLDWMLPDFHGLEVCKQLRKTCTTPVILLTQPGEKTAPLRGLESCADDTLARPFSTREALAHIHAVLRRVQLDRQGADNTPIQDGVFTLDPAGHWAKKGEDELELSAREFDLLRIFMGSPRQALSRAEIMTKVWGNRWFGDPRTLDVHVRWLRLKIEEDPANPHYLQTVHGIGYRFSGL